MQTRDREFLVSLLKHLVGRLGETSKDKNFIMPLLKYLVYKTGDGENTARKIIKRVKKKKPVEMDFKPPPPKKEVKDLKPVERSADPYESINKLMFISRFSPPEFNNSERKRFLVGS